MTNATSSRISGIANVGIPVHSTESTLAFYVDTLGFEVRRDATFGPGLRWVEVAPSGSSTTIALAPAQGETGGVDTGIRLMTQDVPALHSHLKGSGVDVDADILNVPGVPPMFSFRDPEGNTLYIVQL